VPKGKEWPYGSLVDKATRRLRWMAPTTLQKSDPNDGNGGGCLRKFFYRYVLGLKEDEDRTWLGVGIDCHAEIESHLITGANTLGPITMAVRPYLPEPDPHRVRLLVEHDIGGGSLENARFGVDVGYPVPFVGYTDVIHANTPMAGLGLKRASFFVNTEGDGVFEDPPGTVECKDWKFGAAKKGTDRDFSKNSPELASDTQMITQGAWVMSKTPTIAAPIRLSHVYTNTKGRAEASKASILIPRENLLKRWEYIRGATRTLADVARENDPERVPANKYACESFGGCPYAGKPCKVPQDTGLEMFFGGDEAMAIMDELNILGMQPNTQPAPTVTAGPTGVAASLGLDIASQMAALGVAMETPATAPAAPAWKPAQPTKEFVDAVAFIHSKGYGMMPLGGDAAQMFGVLNRHENVTAEYKYPGSLDLAKTNRVDDPARVVAIAREMTALAVKPGTAPAPQPAVAQTPAPMGIASPETPASNPAIASQPVEGFAHPSAVTPNIQVPGLAASVPGTALATTIANTTPAAAPTNVAATVTGDAPKEEPKKERAPRGSKKKAATEAGKPASTAPETSDDARWLFIDSVPNVAYEDAGRFVTEWAQGMAKHFKLAAPYDDIRMAPNDHPLGYGKGLAALSAVAKNAAKHLPPGAYYLNTESDLARAVAEGLTMAKFANADGTDGDPVFELIVRPTVRR
jgi:hypothetical protein